MIKWVTPSLAVAAEADWPELFSLNESTLAVDWIESGKTAFVDNDETAAAVLAGLGLSEADVKDRLHWANTGEVLAQ